MEDRRQLLEKIGKALRHLRTQKNLSIERVAAETGIDARTIQRYESGTTNIIEIWDMVALFTFLDEGLAEFVKLFD